MKTGSHKVAGTYVHDDRDLKILDTTLGIDGVWVRPDGECVGRFEGKDYRAQISHHGAGRRSVQFFDADGNLCEDINLFG
jgi:hypothetical protein